MKSIKFIFVLVILLSSCLGYDTEKTPSDQRLEFRNSSFSNYYNLQGKFLLSKDDYLNLTNEFKKELWLNKIDYILSQPISSGQTQSLNNLKVHINNLNSNEFYLSGSIRQVGILLGYLFCENDFLNTFSSLDLNFISIESIPICQSCINDLITYVDEERRPGDELPWCNCRWNCSDPIGGCNTCQAGKYKGCCHPRKGCGFLWLQDCTGHDQPCAIKYRPSCGDPLISE